MGCNCNKKRRNPVTAAGRKQATEAPKDPKPQDQTQTKASYELRTSSGRVLTFGSSLEARAARVRAGGAGKVSRRS